MFMAAVLLASNDLLEAAEPTGSGVTLHVSPTGNDSHPGTKAEPFATLGRARVAVRDLLRAEPQGTRPIVVLIHGGTYRLSEPLVFGPEDADGRSITWQAAPGEKSILSGGTPVAGWERWKGEIYRAKAPASKGVKALLCNNRALIRARYPNLVPEDPISKGWLFMRDAPNATSTNFPTVGSRDLQARTTFYCFPGELPAWTNWAGVELAAHSWSDDYYDISPVTSVDFEKGRVNVVPNRMMAFHAGNRFYFQNALEALDQPGEYCSQPGGDLYVWPRSPADLKSMSVPSAPSLIVIEGDAASGRLVRGLTFRGLTFTETTDAACVLKAGGKCRFEGNLFLSLAGVGIRFERVAEDNVIEGNEFAYLGESAINLQGPDLDGGKDTMTRNIIRNNHIHHVSQVHLRLGGIVFDNASATVIEHNLVHDVPNFGIYSGGGMMLKYWTEAGKRPWALKKNTINGTVVTRENLKSFFLSRSNLVARNHLYNCSTEVNDTGAIYFWSSGLGNIFRENLVHDVVGYAINSPTKYRYEAMGIYLDGESEGSLVERNIVYRVGKWGLFANQGADNTFRNNIVMDCGEQLIFLMNWDNPKAGGVGMRPGTNLVTGNILINRDWPLEAIAGWPKQPGYIKSDRNLFDLGTWPPRFQDGTTMDLASWQNVSSNDQHSVFTDAGLKDPAHGDFTRLADSPARRLGFPDWDVTGIGLLPGWGKGPETPEGKTARLGGPKPLPYFSRQTLKDWALSKAHKN